jgi:hypothetical protein
MITRFKETQKLLRRQVVMNASHRASTWLPAPAAPMPRALKQRVANRKRNPNSIWIALEGEAIGEKVLIAVLICAAVAGIAYGFSGLLDLVQNWGAFNSWVAQVVQ